MWSDINLYQWRQTIGCKADTMWQTFPDTHMTRTDKVSQFQKRNLIEWTIQLAVLLRWFMGWRYILLHYITFVFSFLTLGTDQQFFRNLFTHTIKSSAGNLSSYVNGSKRVFYRRINDRNESGYFLTFKKFCDKRSWESNFYSIIKLLVLFRNADGL